MIHVKVWTSPTSPKLMLLHYLVTVKTPKMHVNTTSAFNVNYKIAVTCIKFHWQFHKMFWWITQWTFMSEHVFKVSTTNMHISLMATLLVFRSVDDVLVQVKPSLHQAFHRSSTSWIFISYTHCCTTPEISKLKAHDDPGALWWSYGTSYAIFFLFFLL